MCGILIGFGSERAPIINSKLEESLTALNHRGPDNKSSYIDNQVYLGHTRLSIIDKGVSANQPYQFDNLIMVYNGEVFNYIELRQVLEKVGYEFDTNSDTEVVIKAFHYYGTDCFAHFNGMWALGIYDLDKKELVICRDRFGQKPLFVTQYQDLFYASSELLALSKIVPIQPNYAAIASFLKESDFNVDGNTFFTNIFEFPAATFLRISSTGKYDFNSYWSYPEKVLQPEITFTKFHEILENAVEIRLRSDVDYSLLLSGGIDSTIIAGITRKLIGEKASLTAFNYASNDAFNEAQYAKNIAEHFSINLFHNEQECEPEDFVKRLRRLVRHLGRGHGSPAIISVDYLYENLSNKGFKVTLDGQGADELLAGYPNYHFHLIFDLVSQRQWKQVGHVIKDLKEKGVLKVFILALRLSLPPGLRKIMRFIYGYERFFSSTNIMEKQVPLFVNQNSISKKQELFNKYLISQHQNGLKNLLYYGDIVSMANSVENRSPFMDHRLVETAFSSSFRLKVENGQNKAVLKSHPIYLLCKSDLDREKVGFASYISIPIKEQFIEILKSSSIMDWPIIKRKSLLTFLENRTLAVSEKYEPFLFRLFQVHLWAEEFLIPIATTADSV